MRIGEVMPAAAAILLLLTCGCASGPPNNASQGQEKAAPPGPFVHSLGIRFVLIPPGEVRVPPVPGRADGVDMESTALVRPILMSAHEVTNAQYEAFVAAYRREAEEAARNPPPPDSRQRPRKFDPAIIAHKRSAVSPADDCPVVNVSGTQAEEFCRWLSRTDTLGWAYRLPHTAEWEYAARGGRDDMLYPWTGRADASKACFDAAGPKPVGSYPPNRFGLYDLGGNAAEWVTTDDFPPHELRGGAWCDKAPALLIAAQNPLPADGAALDRHGFRIVCEPAPLTMPGRQREAR